MSNGRGLIMEGLIPIATGKTSQSTDTGVTVTCDQGFMQDKIIASRTCFGGHMDVNC